jgi:hypothetical protein
MESFLPLPTASEVHSPQLILEASVFIEHISNQHALCTDRVYINISAKTTHILQTHFERK